MTLNKSCLDYKAICFTIKLESSLGVEKDLELASLDLVQRLATFFGLLLEIDPKVACRDFFKCCHTTFIGKHGLQKAILSVFLEPDLYARGPLHELIISCHNNDWDHDSVTLKSEGQLLVFLTCHCAFLRISDENLLWLEKSKGGSGHSEREHIQVLNDREAVAIWGARKLFYRLASLRLNYLQGHLRKVEIIVFVAILDSYCAVLDLGGVCFRLLK